MERVNKTEEGPFDDETEHPVTLPADYYMGVTHVTRGQFAAFVKDDGYKTEAEKANSSSSWRNPGFDQTDDHPVVYVTWNDAQAFCNWLKRKGGRDYRLPTEAEWEYACRGGVSKAYSFGDDPKKLGDYAWFWNNSGGATHPVATKKPNPFGLYDMQGNAWQWCGDWYAKYPDKAVTDVGGPKEGTNRVLRGGSWSDSPGDCRSASRGRRRPSLRFINAGFRLSVPVP